MEFDSTYDDEQVKRIIKAFPKTVERALDKTALNVHGNIVKEAPKNHGRLAGSWTPKKLSALLWGISSRVKYRFMVQTGTKAHIIRPKNKKALRFKVTQGVMKVQKDRSRFTIKTGAVYAKVVHHPGTKANPYITRAIVATEKRIPEFVDKAIKETLG
ncbi:MAG: HK97 gp10 family phage protein [Candidatus Geothermincolia bacterium]